MKVIKICDIIKECKIILFDSNLDLYFAVHTSVQHVCLILSLIIMELVATPLDGERMPLEILESTKIS
jgi:hypothetical protein